ncbi:MAG: hypothetical protein QMD46_06230 [Methanomicrobiales archaeon]|nr:hypothetical protein [Methanomicrobiales archaeon]MDI6876136.1 hypothetical protein [Methanomicrobiales archaeon]
MANAEVTDAWMGGAADKKQRLSGTVPKESLNKVFYSVRGTLPANTPVLKLVVGVLVDGKLVTTGTIDITKKDSGRENPYWFRYPEERKTPGAHTVQFGIGTADDVDEKTRAVKAWSQGMSAPYPFTIQ